VVHEELDMIAKVQQLEDGACIYENQTFNLSIEEQEEPSGALGTIKGTYW
jgi:hypothetical protein